MKIFYLIFTSILILTACSSDEDVLSPFEKVNYRVIAYQSLSEEELSTLTKDWKTAPVDIGRYRKEDNIHFITIDGGVKLSTGLYDPNMILNNNQALVTVTFNTKDDPWVGPITVIINPENDAVVGQVPRA